MSYNLERRESNIIKYVFVINGTSCTTEMVVSHRNQHFAERARDSTTGNQLFAELWVLPNAILHALSKQSIYRVAKKHTVNIIHLAIQQRVRRVLQTGHLANLNFAECKPHNTRQSTARARHVQGTMHGRQAQRRPLVLCPVFASDTRQS